MKVTYSIIVPIFNCSNYIIDCLKSVKNQNNNHPDNYEVIIIDDGSTDNSKIVASDYCKDDNRFKIYHQRNSGPYNARITGIEHSKGDYLLFLDADDKLRSDALYVLSQNIEKYKPDMLFFNASRSNDFKQKWIHYPFSTIRMFEKEEKDVLFSLALTTTIFNNLATKCVKRSLFISNDFTRHDNFKNGEDVYMCIPLLDKAKSVLFIPDVLYFYRQNGNSTTFSYSESFYQSIVRLYELKLKYASEIGNIELINKVKRRASEMCISAIRNEFRNPSGDYDEIIKRITFILKSDFYKEYRSYIPLNISKSLRTMLLFFVSKYPAILCNHFVCKLLKNII